MGVRRPFQFLPRRSLIGALVALAFSGAALANPTGPAVVSGAASFTTVGKTLTVTNSPNAIIHWQGFSIARDEATRFQQQSAASAVMNRVVGRDPSSILGTLSSNGRVFLLNPNGIVFGAGSRVDVAGLVASTLNLSNQDFLAGRLNFEAGAIANPIQNHGNIATPSGGRVYLIAPNVENHGVISTPQGQTILAAGKSVQLVEADVPNLRVEVQAGGEALNVGQIIADGGSAGIYAGLISQRGVVRADAPVVGEGGRISFRATKRTMLEAGGVTSANGERGGRIEITGEEVGLVGNARVEATGTSGGGTILVGGDYQGKNPEIPNARAAYVGPDATIDASATGSGDGGRVIVWSDRATRAYGTIRARGGAQSGDGGFVETSGKLGLDVSGARVDASAAAGRAGTWLLDPKDIVVVNGGSAALGDVDQFADFSGAPLQIAPATINVSGTNVELQAENDLTFTDPVSISTSGVILTGRAGKSVFVNANISTTNADVTLVANDPSAPGTNRDAGPGGIAMAPGTTIGAGTGKVTLQVGFGPDGASIVAANVTATDIELQQNSPTNGSSILRVSAASLLSGTNLLLEVDHSAAGSGGSIGTASDPIRIQVAKLEAHTHETSPGIFIESPNLGNLQIGGVPFFGGGVKGVQNVTGGDITIRANGTLTTQAGTPIVTCGFGATGGPICTGGSTVTLNANDMSIGNVVNASTGTAALAPFATNVGINIGGSGGLNLSTAELQQITAGMLEIGRNSDTGTLTVATALSSTDINASTLKLAHQNIAVNGSITFSTGNENLTLAAGSGSVTLAADLDVGSGVIDASTSTVNPTATRIITSTNGGTGFSAGTLNIDSTDDVSLNATSSIGTLNLSSGTLQGSGDLTVTGGFSGMSGSINLSGQASLTQPSGNLVADSGITASQIVLSAPAGAISGAGALSTQLLITNSTDGTSLTGANTVSNLSATNSTSGGITFVNSGALDIAAIPQSGGNLSIANAGAINQSGSIAVSGTSSISAGANPITLTIGTNDFTGAVTLTGGATQITDFNALTLGTLATSNLTASATGALNLGQGTVGGALVANSGGGAIAQSGGLTVTGTASITAGAAPITLTQGNDFQGLVTLSNSGAANAVSITDADTISFTALALGGNFTVTAPSIVLSDVTNTGAQTYNGNVTFNSTYTTNGNDFNVTGTTTLGSSSTITTGAGSVTLTGAVNADADPTQETLTINSSGTTTFGNTVGATTALGALTTDSNGTTSLGGNVTTTGTQSFNDPSSGTGITLTSTGGGAILVDNATSSFPSNISTTGAITFEGPLVGTSGTPTALTVTPSGLVFTQTVTAFLTSPALPASITAPTGSSITINGVLVTAPASPPPPPPPPPPHIPPPPEQVLAPEPPPTPPPPAEEAAPAPEEETAPATEGAPGAAPENDTTKKRRVPKCS